MASAEYPRLQQRLVQQQPKRFKTFCSTYGIKIKIEMTVK